MKEGHFKRFHLDKTESQLKKERFRKITTAEEGSLEEKQARVAEVKDVFRTRIAPQADTYERTFGEADNPTIELWQRPGEGKNLSGGAKPLHKHVSRKTIKPVNKPKK